MNFSHLFILTFGHIAKDLSSAFGKIAKKTLLLENKISMSAYWVYRSCIANPAWEYWIVVTMTHHKLDAA